MKNPPGFGWEEIFFEKSLFFYKKVLTNGKI